MLTLAVFKSAAVVAGLSGLAITAFLQWGETGAPAIAMRKVEMPHGAHLMVGIHEVTRVQWQACVEAHACEAIRPGKATSQDMPSVGGP